MPLIAHALSPGLMAYIGINYLAQSFWRVLIISGGSGSTGASEVRFKNKGDPQNGMSLGSGGSHGNAFDGLDTTNWNITGEFGEYVGLEFSGDVEIDEVDVVSLFNDADNTLVNYEVQFSDDGIVWTTMWSSLGNQTPTGNSQVTTTLRPFAAIEGAGLIHQRVYAVMGASNNAMINHIRAYAVMGASNDAMVNSIRVYAIYDVDS